MPPSQDAATHGTVKKKPAKGRSRTADGSHHAVKPTSRLPGSMEQQCMQGAFAGPCSGVARSDTCGSEDATAKPPCSGPACTSVGGSSAGPPNVIGAAGHAHVQLIGPIAVTLTVYPLGSLGPNR